MSGANERTVVRYNAGRIFLGGDVMQDALITAEDMLNNLLETASLRAQDLITIAAGVFVLDRACRRKIRAGNASGVRELRVEFEVSDLDFWNRTQTLEQLVHLLCFLTGDVWLVSFARKAATYEALAPQRILGLDKPLPTRVALFSGGLDSAAGLGNQLLEGKDTYMLLTAGHAAALRSRAQRQVSDLRHMMRAKGLHHAAFEVRFDRGVASNMKAQEKSQRVRGFLFCSVAALLADACGISEIELFENGVGAINLPLTEGGMLEGLSTRGANPGFLWRMGLFVSDVLERPLQFSLPFLWHTKGEMLRKLADRPLLPEWLRRSTSCIHTSIRERGKWHCGHCPACIERRQAFVAAGIKDDSKDYQIDLLSEQLPKHPHDILAYLDSARRWTEGDAQLRARLARHHALSEMTHLPLDALERLIIRHAHESLATYGDLSLQEAA